jgi:hypothetical protein
MHHITPLFVHVPSAETLPLERLQATALAILEDLVASFSAQHVNASADVLGCNTHI